MNVGWREGNQQDATNPMFIIKLLSQHVSGIIMPIIRRIRPCTTAYGVLHWLCRLWLTLVVWSWDASCVHCVKVTVHTVHTAHEAAPQDHSQPQPTHPGRTPHAAIHGLILLMMDIMMPETCWDGSLIINIGIDASCWFLSLHATLRNNLGRFPATNVASFPIKQWLIRPAIELMFLAP